MLPTGMVREYQYKCLNSRVVFQNPNIFSLLSFSLFENKKVSLAKGEPHEVKDHSVKVSYCFVSSRTKVLLHVYSFFLSNDNNNGIL